jgi:hypothetical protein
MSDALRLGILLELGFTRAMHCVAMKSAGWLANKGHMWSSEGFTQHYIRKRRTNSEARTPSLRAMAILPGRVYWKTAKIIHQEVCMQWDGSKLLLFSLLAGIYCHAINICGLPYRPSEDVPSTALSALYGEPMVNVLASAALTRLFRNSCICGLGFRFVLLADDNFYPVSLTDLQLASRQGNTQRSNELNAIRAERFELMERLAEDLPPDMVFFTQITMEAAEDPAFLDAMSKAKIKGALVGIEAVTPQGLKDIYKEFNAAGEDLVNRLRLSSASMACRCWVRSSLACPATGLKLLKPPFPSRNGRTWHSLNLSCLWLFPGRSILNAGKRRCRTMKHGLPESPLPAIGLFRMGFGQKSIPLIR